MKINFNNNDRTFGSLNDEILKLKEQISSLSIENKKKEFKIQTQSDKLYENSDRIKSLQK